jgi:hypothetical protein
MPFITLRLKVEVVVMGQKLTKRALRSSATGIAKQYLDLQKLREEVRRVEIMRGRLLEALYLCMIGIAMVGWGWLIIDGVKWLVS